MTANPVFVKEMRASYFRRKPWQGVLIWLAATGCLLLVAQSTPSEYPLATLFMVALPLIVPAFAAGTFAKEYEQQTWQDLYLTRLTNFEVVIGKFLAALVLVVGLVLSFIPPVLFLLHTQAIQAQKLATQVIAQNFPGGMQPGQAVYYGDGIGYTPGHLPSFGLQWYAGHLVEIVYKLTLSATLYIMLAMTCSRYSTNRRTALVWSYVALSLYAFLGFVIWSSVGVAADFNTRLNGGSPALDLDPIAPGFMGGIHLIFCSVVGLGTLLLMWVSLSEQRGYRGSVRQASDARAWKTKPSRVKAESEA